MGCINGNLSSSKKGMTDDIRHKKDFKSTSFKTLDYRLISNSYTISPRVLGAGNFGKVFLAYHTADHNFKVAIKTLQKKKLGDSIQKIKDEIKILSKLDHPNICRYYETFESPKHFYVVMEYCGGGDLFDKITSKENEMSEQRASVIMRKLIHAINHCHANNIVHRDLKPENIMYTSDG